MQQYSSPFAFISPDDGYLRMTQYLVIDSLPGQVVELDGLSSVV